MERDSTPGSVPSKPSQGRWVLEKNENPATERIGSLLFFLEHTISAKGGSHGQPDLQNHFLLAIKLTVEEIMAGLIQRLEILEERLPRTVVTRWARYLLRPLYCIIKKP